MFFKQSCCKGSQGDVYEEAIPTSEDKKRKVLFDIFLLIRNIFVCIYRSRTFVYDMVKWEDKGSQVKYIEMFPLVMNVFKERCYINILIKHNHEQGLILVIKRVRTIGTGHLKQYQTNTTMTQRNQLRWPLNILPRWYRILNRITVPMWISRQKQKASSRKRRYKCDFGIDIS